jgi:F-type H+-transporting ATPase subunit gamma
MDTLESIRGKAEGAKDLKSVVGAMKAMASSNIVQYQAAVNSLADYYHTVALGIIAYFKAEKIAAIKQTEAVKKGNDSLVCAIVFGSDQGLVGRFNDSLADFVAASLKSLPGKKELWVVGERVQLLLQDMGFKITEHYPVPNSVDEVTPLVQKILAKSEESHDLQLFQSFYIFYNQPSQGTGYQQTMQRFLPLDEKWKDDLQQLQWPTKLPPQIAGNEQQTLLALISGYLFVSLFKACAESLYSENASRLDAMQRAEKNIGDLLDELTKKYNRLRQTSIDEELFDVITGFEALKGKS